MHVIGAESAQIRIHRRVSRAYCARSGDAAWASWAMGGIAGGHEELREVKTSPPSSKFFLVDLGILLAMVYLVLQEPYLRSLGQNSRVQVNLVAPYIGTLQNAEMVQWN